LKLTVSQDLIILIQRMNGNSISYKIEFISFFAQKAFNFKKIIQEKILFRKQL
jgi:hypothetical protein